MSEIQTSSFRGGRQADAATQKRMDCFANARNDRDMRRVPARLSIKTEKSEKGSIFFYILLAVALFAALSYAVSRNNTGSTNVFDEESAKLAAQEIIEYGNNVANAVQKLKLRGCSDTEISFENDIVAGYENPNSPVDKSCHVFDLNGGNIVWSSGLKDLQPIHSNYQHIRYVGRTHILDIGSINSELKIFYRTSSKEFCMNINDYAGINNDANDAPSELGAVGNQFIGNYINSQVIGDDNDGVNFSGKILGCYKDVNETDTDGSPFYDFYQVLIAR